MYNVCVYGNLKEGYHNHSYLGDSKKIATGYITGYDMYLVGTRDHGYPYLICSDNTDKIPVEIYQINHVVLKIISHLKMGYDVKIEHVCIGTRKTKPCIMFYVRKDNTDIRFNKKIKVKEF